jgi:SAM-dependent methyltransferase
LTEVGDRVRARRGPARLVDGVPYSDPSTTLSLIPGAAIGEWLHDQRHLVRGRLLDAGCGNRPFAPWYQPLVSEAVGLDAAPAAGVVVGSVEAMPFEDVSFDTVLCTEVLEHVDDSEAAAAELFRVTAPGGHALVTAPFLYPVHEAPHDMRRFTHHGLRDLMERHGFEVLGVEAAGGVGRLALHWCVLALVAAAGGLVERPAVRTVIAAPQQALVRARPTRRELRGSAVLASLGYMVAARRP